jgi:hypothetical protein
METVNTAAIFSDRRKSNAEAITASYYGFTPRNAVEKVADLAMAFADSQVKVVDEDSGWDHAENFRSYITFWVHDWEDKIEWEEVEKVKDFFKAFGFEFH